MFVRWCSIMTYPVFSTARRSPNQNIMTQVRLRFRQISLIPESSTLTTGSRIFPKCGYDKVAAVLEIRELDTDLISWHVEPSGSGNQQKQEGTIGWICSLTDLSYSKKSIKSLFTYGEIARWLIGHMSENWPVINKHKLISLSHPTTAFGCAFNYGVFGFYPLSNLPVSFILTCLESFMNTWRAIHSDLIRGLHNIFKVIDRTHGILHREKSGQICSVCWNPD